MTLRSFQAGDFAQQHPLEGSLHWDPWSPSIRHWWAASISGSGETNIAYTQAPGVRLGRLQAG